uniref:Uncharacterized protein n=1 Tax=Solanum tuberosum TaxID=4113 RepID=M1CPC3_SOLTU
MTVPPNADVIHGEVQDRVEGDGPVQASPSIIATPVLQDILAHPMVAPDSQTPRTQPVAVVAPHLDSMELPGIASHLANRPSMTVDEQKMFGSVLSPEGKDQVGGEREQSAYRRIVSRSSTMSPNDTENDDAEGWCKTVTNYTKGQIAKLIGDSD